MRRRRQRERGSALIIVMITILFMVILMTAYTESSLRMANRTTNEENRYRAKSAAISGLNKAISELDLSSGTACNHFAHDGFNCWGNLDGNVIDAMDQYDPGTHTTTGAKNRCYAGWTGHADANHDVYNIDTGATAPNTDGFIDFQDQTTAATAQVALFAADLSGSYTVRCKVEGNGVPGDPNPTNQPAAYRLRTYGVSGREVAGFEAIVYLAPPQPLFTYAAYGANGVRFKGTNATTDSFASGWPTASGGFTAGNPTPPAAYDPNNHNTHGDVGVGSGATIQLPNSVGNSGPTVQGAIWGNYSGDLGNVTQQPPNPTPAAPPDVTVPVEASSGLLNGTVGLPLAGQDLTIQSTNFDLGAAGAPVNGGADTSIVLGSLEVKGTGALNIYPASGQTITIWLRGPKLDTGGQAGLNIFQPAAFWAGTDKPGTVIFYLEGTGNPPATYPGVTSAATSGNAAVNGTATAPAATCQFYCASNAAFTVNGNGSSSCVVDANNATVNLNGNGAITGSIIARNVTVNGNGQFHYDESLKNLVPKNTRPSYRIMSLVEMAGRTQ
jgi:Tfp pilus assembly protein PilX